MEIKSRVTVWSQDTMNKYQWLDECLLARPATLKKFYPGWQAYQYTLKGKMYAYIGFNDKNGRPIITLKLEPMFSQMLCSQYDDVVLVVHQVRTHSFSLAGMFQHYVVVSRRSTRYASFLRLALKYASIATNNKTLPDRPLGYYMNKQHWSTVYLDGDVPQKTLTDMVYASYQVMFSSLSKKAQREITEE